jgi:hypothetical protein
VGSGDHRLRPSIMRRLSVGLGFAAALAIAGLAVAPAAADYTDGVIAANKISMEAAIRIWRKRPGRTTTSSPRSNSATSMATSAATTNSTIPSNPMSGITSPRSATASTSISAILCAARDLQRLSPRAAEQQKLMLLMNAEQREQARNRIVYILSCRGADGFIKLGQLHSTSHLRTDAGAGRRFRRSIPSKVPQPMAR